MASIHKNLILDHLYFATHEQEFENIKTIFAGFTCASHQVVKSDNDSWEGVYVSTRGQYYLEFLKDRRVNGIGICQKAFFQMWQDSRNIVHDFPDLPWKTFDRSIDGKPWFTAISCENYLDLSTKFNTWIMYYPQSIDNKIYPFKKYEVTKISDFYFSANPNLKETIKLNSTWFNAKKEITDDKVIFDMQTFYSDSFKINISFDNQNEGFQFKSCRFKFQDDIDVSEHDLTYFKFYKSNGEFVLEKK